jgi:Arc/MetJ-type ribon-helix-helix transcriptional regulator
VVLRSSSKGKAEADARAYARMGLMIALGRLQEMAGDDRRVTATADLGMDPSGSHRSRYWTGVWSNPAAASEIYTSTPKAQFEGWLVSGDEAMLSNPDSTTVPLGGGVTLVGAATAGSSATEHVTVPLVAISPGTHNMAGNYGYWVGDEGVKTRINLPSTGNPSTSATDLTLGSRGGGWETVAGMESFPGRGAPAEATLPRLITLPTTAVALPSVRAAATNQFHGMTVDSRGLLTDTQFGGLRMDLTPYLENGFPTSPASASFTNAPVMGKNILPTAVAPNIKGPTWDRLRALRTMKPPAGGKLTVAVGNAGDQAHIAPILLDVRLLMGAKLVSNPANDTQYRIYPCGKISVALANPYPYPLRWTQSLEVEVFRQSGGTSRIWEAAGRPMFIPDSPGNASVFGRAVFTIPAGELAPGEAQAYTMAAQVNRPQNANPITVPLGPYLAQGPADFRKSIVMEHSSINTGSRQVEVREPSNTAVVAIELRTPGSGTGAGVLRRIDGFELDNAFFTSVRRRVDETIAKQMTEPFPLHLYSFQMSQPGMDYGSLLPAASQLGVRNSTLRTYMDFNMRAQRFPRAIAGYLALPYFMESSDNLASLPFNSPGGDTGTGFTRNLAMSPLPWGHSSVSGPRKTILFDAPEAIVSLAQFQHADLTADDRYTSVSVQPGNAPGNSYASPFVKRGLSSEIRYDYVMNSTNSATGTANRYYDMSYLLNTALWDSFFLSTVPANGATTPLNPRIAEIVPGTAPTEVRDPLRAASRLWVEGGFNVNSTRKDAWKALLASNRKLKHPSDTSTPTEGAMFPRSLRQLGQAPLPKPSGNGDDSLNGFRRLNDAQLDALAEEITRQVRLRGPFVSLSHFVNRALVDLSADTDNKGRSGALQSAIDDSGLNMSPGKTDSGFANLSPANNLVRMQKHADGRPEADMVGTRGTLGGIQNHPSDSSPPVWTSTSRDLNPGNTGSLLADRVMLTDDKYRPEQGFRSTGIPGWLTQADVLQAIGPVISARSDTFRIRSYGEALDASGKIVARAWCEAIVQRRPEFTDAANPPETRPANLNPANAKFGRRIEIVSMRWLHPDEI